MSGLSRISELLTKPLFNIIGNKKDILTYTLKYINVSIGNIGYIFLIDNLSKPLKRVKLIISTGNKGYCFHRK
jgi:hypothetical protein